MGLERIAREGESSRFDKLSTLTCREDEIKLLSNLPSPHRSYALLLVGILNCFTKPEGWRVVCDLLLLGNEDNRDSSVYNSTEFLNLVGQMFISL